MLLLRLLRWSRMWLKFSFSLPLQLRFRWFWKKALCELAQQPPHAGTCADAVPPVSAAPPAAAMSRPPVAIVFLSTVGLLLSRNGAMALMNWHPHFVSRVPRSVIFPSVFVAT